jgi:hypothetical protein
MELIVFKQVMTKNVSHDLFVIYHFHLLPIAEKPTQALAGPSIWVLCDHNRSTVEILE